MENNYFVVLNNINVNDKTEEKNGLTYLSWAWAWGEIKKKHPDATYTIYENADGCFYHTDGKTCWVKTGVTVNGIEHIEYLPVMDYKNKSIPLNAVTSFDVNKTIQRSLTKACARHGLGLYVYAGEDLPEEEKPKQKDEPKKEVKKTASRKASPEQINQLKQTYGSKFEEWMASKGFKSEDDITMTFADEQLKAIAEWRKKKEAEKNATV